MIKRTIKLNRKLKVTTSGVNIFYPYKGTPLGEQCFEDGLVDLHKFDNFSNERRESVLKFSKEHEEMIMRYYDNWSLLVHPFHTYQGMIFRVLKYRNMLLTKLGIYDIVQNIYRSQKKWFRPGRAS